MSGAQRTRLTLRPLAATLLGLLLAAGCSRVSPPTQPAFSAGRLELARYVAVGNSITSGYQSGGLVDLHQDEAYPVLIAQRARVPGFHHPRISAPGLPSLLVLDFTQPTPPLLPFSIHALPGEGALENESEAPFQNLGIPGARIGDFFSTDTSGYFGVVLRGGGSMWAQLKAQRPTLVTFWLGANDALNALLSGTPDSLTDPQAFEAALRAAVDSVRSTGAAVLVANIPDVTDIPYATTVQPYLFDPITGRPVLVLGGQVPFIGQRDGAGPGPLEPGTLLTLSSLYELLQGDGLPEGLGGSGHPLSDDVVLTPIEIAAIRARTDAFNRILESVCAARNVPVVDMRGLYLRIARDGYFLGGVPYSSRYIFGGIFSLDGIHPTAFGQALVANEWIRALNQNFGASIAPVDLGAFTPPIPGAPAAPVTTAEQMMSVLRAWGGAGAGRPITSAGEVIRSRGRRVSAGYGCERSGTNRTGVRFSRS